MIARSRVWRPAIRRSPSQAAPYLTGHRPLSSTACASAVKGRVQAPRSLGRNWRTRLPCSPVRDSDLGSDWTTRSPHGAELLGRYRRRAQARSTTRTTSSSTRSSRSSSSPTAWAATPPARSRRTSPSTSSATRSRPSHDFIERYAKGDATVRPQEVLTHARARGAGRRLRHLSRGPGRAGEARHGHHHLRPAHLRRSRLHRPRRRQPHLPAARAARSSSSPRTTR